MFRILLLLSVGKLLCADVSKKQLEVLQTVRDVARTISDNQGETYENTLSAICLTESSGGVHILGDVKKGTDITKASLGALQIQLATAKHIAKLTPSLNHLLKLSDTKLATLLLTDVKTSTKIAAHLLVRLKHSRKKYFNMVSGYNGGYSNAPYYKRVKKNLNLVYKLVKKNLLQ
ncbi:transglycosylase SLT domain-containing protein [Sulfurimonas lithotrophica]|uniref:transglycosylase SLT domain-containing protein n=1 Tax=Sulfurimonas lithotrophica TaxID=2590022 RepID=UPI00165EFC62|nr:transglycosylase SLT domain-containing protein [Sulfurimonas lithotrophica]